MEALDKFWKMAVAACGLAGVAAYVFYKLNDKWLSLPIFSQMTAAQTFTIMALFLTLVFFALLAMLKTYQKTRHQNHVPVPAQESLVNLSMAWKGTNEINCDELIGRRSGCLKRH